MRAFSGLFFVALTLLWAHSAHSQTEAPLDQLLSNYYSNIHLTDVDAQKARIAALEELRVRVEVISDFDSMWQVARAFIIAKAAEYQFNYWACQKQDEVLFLVVQRFPGSNLIRDRAYPQRRAFREFCNPEGGFYHAYRFLRSKVMGSVGKYTRCERDNPQFDRYLDIAGQIFSIRPSGSAWVDREVDEVKQILWNDIQPLGCDDYAPENFLTYYP